MRRQKIIMGTGVSIDIPAAKNDAIFDKVFELLQDIDNRLSTYKKDSELRKYQRGEIALSSELKKIRDECAKYEKLTDGYFSANFAGKFDPTGYVKGWAIDRTGKLLEKLGYETFCVSIGGDILAKSDGSKEWAIGIQDPADSKKILNMLSIFSGAVATSGSYERGQHIINPKTGQPATELQSVTVVGSDIIKADVLATAVFASGQAKPEFLERFEHYQVLAIER